jgi:hypothetical protein
MRRSRSRQVSVERGGETPRRSATGTAGAPTSERAKAFAAAPGFPDLGTLIAAHHVPDAEAYPLSKELLLLWTCGPCRPRISPCSRTADCE